MSPGTRRLQEAEVQRYADYQEAVASGDGGEIKARQEVWLNVFERLRRVEATNPEVEKLKKESIPIAEVEIEFSKLCGAIRAKVDVLPTRFIW